MTGQIALLVALALLVAQSINFGLILRERNHQTLTRVTAPAIARLADAIERDRAGQRLTRQRGRDMPRRGVFVDSASRVTPEMTQRPDIAARAADALDSFGIAHGPVQAAEARMKPMARNNRVGRLAHIIERRDGGDAPPYLIVSAQVAPDRWITSVGRLPERDPRFLFWLVAQTVLMYVLVLGAVLWIVRRLSRPLKQLTGAVESFRSPDTAVEVPESGPEDVRRLIAAYNGMRTRISGLIDEKDRMLGAIGHDLRTPLASLRVRAEGMDDDDERERMAATIEEMNATLDNILSLARLGKPSEAETRVDLTALLDQIVDDFQAMGAPVTLAEAPRTLATIRPTLIARTVRNLIDNAVKYGDAARVDVMAADGGLAVTVDDDGPGIPEDRMDEMFEPFARMEESRSRETGGTGLGLALAKAIALQHGGRITLANRAGGGLRATLWLPG